MTLYMYLDERNDGTSSKAQKEGYNDPIRAPAGPITRSRMKKFKEELNAMVRGVCEQAETWRPIEGMELGLSSRLENNDQSFKWVVRKFCD